MADLLGLKQKFSLLVHSAQPWILSHFVMWLDLKIAEYKVHGHMILDEDATTQSRPQDATSSSPFTIVVDKETSTLSQQDRQQLLYQKLSSQLNLPTSSTAIPISQTRPSEASKHFMPGLARSSRSHLQQAGPGGPQTSQSSPSLSGEERDPRHHSPSLGALPGPSLGDHLPGALAASDRLPNNLLGCGHGGGMNADFNTNGSHLNSQRPGKTLSSPLLCAAARNSSSLPQPVPVSQFSRGGFSRGNRVGSCKSSLSKWRFNRRPCARGMYSSVNGPGMLFPEQPGSYHSSGAVPSQGQGRTASDVDLMQRNHQPGIEEQHNDTTTIIALDDDHTTGSTETSAKNVSGSEQGAKFIHRDPNNIQQQTEQRSASNQGEKTTGENAEAAENSPDLGLPLSVAAAFETDSQGPPASQHDGVAHSSAVMCHSDATSTELQDTGIPASSSKGFPSNSSPTDPGRWMQQPVEQWPSAAPESSTVGNLVAFVKEEPDSSEYEHSLQPVSHMEIDGTILGNFLDYPGPPMGPEAGDASGSGLGQQGMQWASGSRLLGSQSTQAFPGFGRGSVAPRKFSSMMARRAFTKNSNVQSADRVVCQICGATFRFKSSLSRHKALHAEKRYHCFVCTKAFHRKEHLVHHLDRQHDKMVSSRCPVCQQQLSSLRHLEDHFFFCHGALGGRGGLFGRHFQSVMYQS